MVVLGWIMIHALFVLAGGALLVALELVGRDARSLLWALGPAYLTGVALVVLPLIALAVIGIPIGLPTILVVALLEAGALLAFALTRGDWGRASVRAVIGQAKAERGIVLFLAAGVVVYLLLAGAALKDAPVSWDEAHMWSMRAVAIYHYDGLVDAIFTNVAAFAPFHMDYPPFQPTFEATIYHGLGHEAVQYIHIELWGLYAAAIWTAAWLLAPGRRAIAWLPPLAAIAVAGGPQNSPTLGNADLTAGLFVGLGALCLGLWLQRRATPHLVLGALFLAAGANSKKEGLVFAAAIAVAIVGVLVAIRAWRALGRLAIAGAGALVPVVPWLLYVRANDLPSGDTTPLSKIFAGDYLSSRVGRLGTSLDTITGWLVNSIWAYTAPALLGVAIVCFVARRARPIAAFYASSVALMVLALLWMYWTGNFADLPAWLELTGQRVVGTMAIVSAFGLAHLAATLALPARAGRAEPDGEVEELSGWLDVSDPPSARTRPASPAPSTPR
jgi:hypothetical protein